MAYGSNPSLLLAPPCPLPPPLPTSSLACSSSMPAPACPRSATHLTMDGGIHSLSVLLDSRITSRLHVRQYRSGFSGGVRVVVAVWSVQPQSRIIPAGFVLRSWSRKPLISAAAHGLCCAEGSGTGGRQADSSSSLTSLTGPSKGQLRRVRTVNICRREGYVVQSAGRCFP